MSKTTDQEKKAIRALQVVAKRTDAMDSTEKVKVRLSDGSGAQASSGPRRAVSSGLLLWMSAKSEDDG